MSTALNMTDQYLMELHLKGAQESLTPRIKEALDSDLGYEDFLNLCYSAAIMSPFNYAGKMSPNVIY